MPKKYRVRLSSDQRAELEAMTRTGTCKVHEYRRARILLLSDENRADGGQTDEQIAAKVEVSRATVSRVRRRFVEGGLAQAVPDKPRPGAPKKFDGADRAAITALACSEPPAGYSQWSLRLLAEKAVELELVEDISHKTVRQILKKTNCNPTANGAGVSAS